MQLNADFYAYPERGRYPVHTKEAALQSFADYVRDKDTFSSDRCSAIEARFEKAAKYHGIDCKVEQRKVAARVTRSFTAGDSVIEIGLICSKDDANNAAAMLLEKRATMKREDLANVARYILKAASNFECDVDLPLFGKVASIAGIGVGDREEIQEEVLKRASMVVMGQTDKTGFFQWYNELCSMPDDEFYKNATLDKICSAIESMDKLYGNDRQYGVTVEPPEDVVFRYKVSDLLKTASDFLFVPSMEMVLSKRALVAKEPGIRLFLSSYFNAPVPDNTEGVLEKVASLDRASVQALLKALE